MALALFIVVSVSAAVLYDQTHQKELVRSGVKF